MHSQSLTFEAFLCCATQNATHRTLVRLVAFCLRFAYRILIEIDQYVIL